MVPPKKEKEKHQVPAIQHFITWGGGGEGEEEEWTSTGGHVKAGPPGIEWGLETWQTRGGETKS